MQLKIDSQNERLVVVIGSRESRLIGTSGYSSENFSDIYFHLEWVGRLSERFERKITGKSGQKSPKFNSKLLKDVQKIEKHFEDAEIEITEIQVCKSKDSKHA